MEDSQLSFTSNCKVHKNIPAIKALTLQFFHKNYLYITSTLTPILPMQLVNWFPHLSISSIQKVNVLFI